MQLTPVAKVSQPKSLATLTYEAIRENIIAGYFKPGDWLRQDELSEMLGVSPTPIRQALERMIVEGLVERVPNRGVRVIRVSRGEIAEVYSFRLLLEPMIFRLAALNITRREIDELQEIVDESASMNSLDDMAARRQLNRRFHMLICEASKSPMLNKLYEIVWNRFPDWTLYEGYFRRKDRVKGKLDREVSEHLALIQALASGDPDQAEKFAYENIQDFLHDDLIEILDIPPETLEEKQEQLWPRFGPLIE